VIELKSVVEELAKKKNCQDCQDCQNRRK